MDADIEMIKSARRNDDVGPAEDLDDRLSPAETDMQKQNTFFVVGMISFLFIVLAFIGKVYLKEERFDLPDLEYEPTPTEELTNGVDPKLVAEGTTKYSPFQKGNHQSTFKGKHHKNKTATMMGHTVDEDMDMSMMHEGSTMNTPSDEGDLSEEVQAWLKAVVTLDDGKMYEVVEQINHDSKSFLEGLTYFDGKLYESIGMFGKSALLRLDPDTGDTLERYDMDPKYFGEGLTYADGKLIQLTYKRNTGFIYDANDLSKPPTTFEFHTTTEEGWGFTYDSDRHELIVSDGSEFLHIWDPDTLVEKRKVPVTLLDGSKAKNVNELEYWRGRVLANLWFRDVILVIHPETGVVEKEYDFSALWPSKERKKQHADVLNGISVSGDPDIIYVTGKYWDRMFKVRLLYNTINNDSKINKPSDEGSTVITPSDGGSTEDVQAWLDAVVTLDDGKKFEIVEQINHDSESFLEGLTYFDGKLYESVGMCGESALLRLDPDTGDTLERYDMDPKYFGEGLTYVDGKLIQLTYTSNIGFIYDANDLSKAPTTFEFHTTTEEGWGFTYDSDRHELIVSDGSEFLHIWDPDTLQEKRKVPVTLLNGSKANNINELEYWRGRVLANVWFRDIILVIHPETGAVEKEYDFTELWSSQERTQQRADVLNGISVSGDPDVLYFTGKYWNRMFKVRLLY